MSKKIPNRYNMAGTCVELWCSGDKPSDTPGHYAPTGEFNANQVATHRHGKYSRCKSCAVLCHTRVRDRLGDTRFSSASRKALYEEHPMLWRSYTMAQGAAERSKKDGLEFDLYTRGKRDGSLEAAARRVFTMMEDTGFMCPALGTPYTDSGNNGQNSAAPESPSLDRIDPTRGYTWDNIWVISHRANSIKRDATERELYAVADAVYRERIQRELGDIDDDTSIRHRGGRPATGADNNLAADDSRGER